MIILRNKLFSKEDTKKKNKENEEESEDTKFSNKLTKAGKKVAIAGGITAGLGAGIGGGLLAIGGKRGAKANSDISNLKDDIRSHEFFMKDIFGDRNRPGFFGNSQRERAAQHGRLKSEAEDKIREILRKDGKHAKANKAGKIVLPIAAGISTGLAAAGGIAYGIGKGREIAKRRRLDILKKDREEMRREIEEEEKNNKKGKKK